MNFSKYAYAPIFTALLLICNYSSASAWIIVLNGTSSTGKTTLARNLQKIKHEPCEILQFDVEADLLLKEQVEAMGYCYDSKSSIRTWVDSLPSEVQKKIDDIDDDVAWVSIQKSIIEKAQKFNAKGINVIIDTGLKSEDDYNLFANGLRSNHTYFVLLYASITQLLKNLMARNDAGISEEKRNPLGPFFQYFWFLAKKCESTSTEKLDVLTKKDFETVFDQLETLLESKDKFDECWASKKDFQKIKSIIDHEFFHTCWSYTPHCLEGKLVWLWLKTWLPCYCDEQDAIGITLKLPIIHDLTINTGMASPTECAETLAAWLDNKIK